MLCVSGLPPSARGPDVISLRSLQNAAVSLDERIAALIPQDNKVLEVAISREAFKLSSSPTTAYA